jgi:hypothetical protein
LQATQALKKNFDNRKLKQHLIKRLHSEIKAKLKKLKSLHVGDDAGLEFVNRPQREKDSSM